MHYRPSIIFELDPDYNQKNIERIFTSISLADLTQNIIKLSKDKPLIPWQYQFGDLFSSNVYVGGDEYVLGKIYNRHTLIFVEDIIGNDYLQGIPEE